MGFIEKNYFINDFARKTIMSYYNQNVLKLITEFSKIDSIMDYKMFCGLINKTGVLSKHRKTILSLKRVYGESLLYGHLSSIEHFAEIKKRDLKYFPIMEHGVTFWEIVNASGFPRVCQGDYLRENWKRKYPGVPLFCVGPYIHYADYYYSLEKRTALKKELGKTLLIVPAHTHEMASQDYDMQGFVDSIMRAKSSYQTVMVLAYWADLKYPLYDCFINAGAKVVSAGFRGDPYFISRLKTILSLADIVVGNDIGTFIGYAHYLKKPVRLLPNTIEYTFRDLTLSQVNREVYQENSKQLYHAFSDSGDPNMQNALCEKFWGIGHEKTKEELNQILNINKHILKYARGNISKISDAALRYLNSNEISKSEYLLLKNAISL
ncbi:MAG TPA: hypothetical protein IAA58_10695 [Candidatus Gallacutalibacter stercoravium]|nr:hypothetical protein [Candidatus Gallacutalibacter stercoravium]